MTTLPSRVSGSLGSGRLPAEFQFSGTSERIVLAALDRFAQVGFEATSIRDIAGDIGLNSATLYSHFANKEAILSELVTIGHQAHHSRLMKAVLSTSGGPASQLAAFTREHVRFHCEYARLAVVANAELHALSPEAAAPAHSLRTQSVAMVTEILERGQAAGVFEVLQVDVTVAAIAALGRQAAHWYPSPMVDANAEQLAEQYATLVLRMVVPWPRS